MGNVTFVNGLPERVGGPYEMFYPRIIVQDDAIRTAITGDRFNFASESQVYAIKYGMIRTLMKQGYEVLVDDTHTTEISIRRLIEINMFADFCLVDTDISVCIARAKNTKQEDLVPVIRRQHDNLKRLIGLRVGDPLPESQTLAVAIANKMKYIRGDVIERMEHTKRV